MVPALEAQSQVIFFSIIFSVYNHTENFLKSCCLELASVRTDITRDWEGRQGWGIRGGISRSKSRVDGHNQCTVYAR
jgi:hypothetical protein